MDKIKQDKVQLPLEAVILAGGLGTRLGTLTEQIPKPMLMVRGKPFLEHTLVWLRDQGVRRFIFAIAHKAKVVEAYFGNGSQWKVEVVYSNPDGRQMGTGGAVKEAEGALKGEDFFVLNGDVYFEIPVSQLFNFHYDKGAYATLAIAHVPEIKRYGMVVLDSEGRIIHFLEKGSISRDNLDSKQQFINGGIYAFNRKIFSFMPAGEHCSLELDVFPKLAGRYLWGMTFPEVSFLDIGTPQDYQSAQRGIVFKSFKQ